MAPKLTKAKTKAPKVIHHYSKSFKWMTSKQKTGKMYKMKIRILEKVLWLSKTSLVCTRL